MSFSLNNLGSWWQGGDQQQGASPLSGYADKMKAAMAQPQQQSPLVAAYTPPTYQTTPPHVDINAVIAAMNAQKAAAQPMAQPAGSQMAAPQMSEGGAAGGQQGSDFGGMASGMELAGLDKNARDNVDAGAAGFAGGGMVTPSALGGPDPAGPDAGYAALQPGEFVMKKDAVEAVGKKPLEKMNEDGDKAIAKKVAERVGKRNDGPKKGK